MTEEVTEEVAERGVTERGDVFRFRMTKEKKVLARRRRRKIMVFVALNSRNSWGWP